jgi:hypothetical protein
MELDFRKSRVHRRLQYGRPAAFHPRCWTFKRSCGYETKGFGPLAFGAPFRCISDARASTFPPASGQSSVRSAAAQPFVLTTDPCRVAVPADERVDFAKICDPGHIPGFTSAACGPYHCTHRPTFVGPGLTLPYPLPFFSRCTNRGRLLVSLQGLSVWTPLHPHLAMSFEVGIPTDLKSFS